MDVIFFGSKYKGFLERSFCVNISNKNGKIVKSWTVTLGKRIVSLYIFGSFNKFYKQFIKILIQSECTFLLHTVDSANSF